MTDPYELVRRWVFALLFTICALLAIIGVLLQGILSIIFIVVGVSGAVLTIWGLIKTKPTDGL